MSATLEVLPVLHARGGHLVGPDGRPVESDLKAVGRELSRDHGALYLVDLDGLQRNRPDLGLVQDLAARVPLWADCGSRHPPDVMDLFVAGAEQVTVRSSTVHDEEALREMLRLTENVALGLEFRAGVLVPNARWPATAPEVTNVARTLGLALVVVDLERAGRADGADRGVAWHARNHGPGAYFAGGIGTPHDLEMLSSLGYRGALVGTALLSGAKLSGTRWPGAASHEEPAAEGTS